MSDQLTSEDIWYRKWNRKTTTSDGSSSCEESEGIIEYNGDLRLSGSRKKLDVRKDKNGDGTTHEEGEEFKIPMGTVSNFFYE